MTAPAPTWPGLGFDPAPGNAATVGQLTQQLSQVATLLGVTHDRLTDVQKGRGSWQGEGAAAFAAKFGELPRYLDDAATSLGKAKAVLAGWHDTLTAFQQQGRTLEAQAAQALAAASSAEHAENVALSDPALGQAGRVVPLDQMPRIQAAVDRVDQARARVNAANDSLEQLRRHGKELLGRHEDAARQAADGVRRADDGLAPLEPGWFEKAMTWIGDHLKDIADVTGAIAAVAGALALIPALTPFAGPVALAAAGVTLALDVADTSIHGQWKNPDQLGKLGLDVVGIIPGIKAGVGIVKAARAGEEIGSVAGRVGEAVAAPSKAAKEAYEDSPIPKIIDRWVAPAHREGAEDVAKKVIEGNARVGKAGERLADVGQPREGENDWGVGAFKDSVDDAADTAHGWIDTVAGGTGLADGAHDLVDTVAGSADAGADLAGGALDTVVGPVADGLSADPSIAGTGGLGSVGANDPNVVSQTGEAIGTVTDTVDSALEKATDIGEVVFGEGGDGGDGDGEDHEDGRAEDRARPDHPTADPAPTGSDDRSRADRSDEDRSHDRPHHGRGGRRHAGVF